ncbi:uncharacterized protein M6B38_376350 [Iris pallida]|uniref:Uncharacterized protein n=1 Tax=Iris pallida TaxID=29817 RepID=A0AAX6G9Y8_IRIPA|nr:uncharacterized protein M6B38_376350 [Iris pallida]
MRRAAAKTSPDPGPNPTRNHPNSRRRVRNPVARFPSASTPLLQWKLEDPLPGPDPPTKARDPQNAAERASARKLAAGMWRSEFQEIEPGLAQLQVPHSLKHGSNPKVLNSRKFKSSAAALPNPSLERATKWDAKCSKPSEEVHQSFDHLKLLMDQEMTKASTAEAKLKAELNWARGRIMELEAKHHSSKKKIESFLKKHTEEKASWRTREHEKIRAVIDGMRGDLSVERKNRRRTEVLNAKLIEELAEAKKSAKRYLQDYEKEKKARELVEEVCNELAKEVGEDRMEAEETKREAVRVREELEEERKMLQMAEVWREERVQMKLIDAKQAVEERCSRLKGLQMELEEFLSSRNRASSVEEDGAEIREAELLIEAVAEAVKMQEMNAFSYQPPPASEDILAIFEELQQRGEERPNERVVETCHDGGSAASGGASDDGTASPATDIFLGKPTNGSCCGDEEDDSEWETLSNSGEGSDDSNGETSNEASRRKDNCLLEPRIYKKTPVVVVVEEAAADGRVSKGGLSEADLGLPKLEQWGSSPESANPDAAVAQGAKGCIEWPCGSVHKHSLKAKLLEARLECNKFQIRHVIKQKS